MALIINPQKQLESLNVGDQRGRVSDGLRRILVNITLNMRHSRIEAGGRSILAELLQSCGSTQRHWLGAFTEPDDAKKPGDEPLARSEPRGPHSCRAHSAIPAARRPAGARAAKLGTP